MDSHFRPKKDRSQTSISVRRVTTDSFGDQYEQVLQNPESELQPSRTLGYFPSEQLATIDALATHEHEKSGVEQIRPQPSVQCEYALSSDCFFEHEPVPLSSLGVIPEGETDCGHCQIPDSQCIVIGFRNCISIVNFASQGKSMQHPCTREFEEGPVVSLSVGYIPFEVPFFRDSGCTRMMSLVTVTGKLIICLLKERNPNQFEIFRTDFEVLDQSISACLVTETGRVFYQKRNEKALYEAVFETKATAFHSFLSSIGRERLSVKQSVAADKSFIGRKLHSTLEFFTRKKIEIEFSKICFDETKNLVYQLLSYKSTKFYVKERHKQRVYVYDLGRGNDQFVQRVKISLP